MIRADGEIEAKVLRRFEGRSAGERGTLRHLSGARGCAPRCARVLKFMLLGVASVAVMPPGVAAKRAVADPYAPLRLYQGAWTVHSDGQAKPDRLVDDCARAGRFFACQQTVNDKRGPLVIFIPQSAGRYDTQVVLPNGAALGPPGTLMISGHHWIYLTAPDAKGVRYRTTNDFLGRDRIRFVVAQCRKAGRWVVTLSGIEDRMP
jgi:hypothetical protein